jgi:hypothetical protein
MEMGQRQVLSQRQSMSIEQKLDMRMALLAALHSGEDVVLSPKAQCPSCSYKLEPVEIVRGFRRDPLDTTTKCPECACRFQPIFRGSLGGDSYYEVHFMCAMQTLEALGDAESRLPPAALRKANPRAYYSALFHYGTVKEAFKAKGWDYAYDQTHGWEDKVAAFLGEIPDSIIASTVGVPVQKVTAFRRKLGIKKA